MAKKARAPPPAPTAPAKPSQAVFPALAPKEGLECNVVLEDQIVLIDVRGHSLKTPGFFSQQECKEYVKFIDSLPLELTPPKKRGEAERVNHRMSISSVEYAQRLLAVLAPHLPNFPYPAWGRRPAGAADRRPVHSLNSNIRVYKYEAGQYFGPHYDDSVRDAATGAKSEWTLLVYLTGAQDGVEGGETIFYRDQRGKQRETIVPPLTRGTALLHRHGQDCLLHEGSPVLKGTKYVLRSDLMFMK